MKTRIEIVFLFLFFIVYSKSFSKKRGYPLSAFGAWFL